LLLGGGGGLLAGGGGGLLAGGGGLLAGGGGGVTVDDVGTGVGAIAEAGGVLLWLALARAGLTADDVLAVVSIPCGVPSDWPDAAKLPITRQAGTMQSAVAPPTRINSTLCSGDTLAHQPLARMRYDDPLAGYCDDAPGCIVPVLHRPLNASRTRSVPKNREH
jgi:hypothetical protein